MISNRTDASTEQTLGWNNGLYMVFVDFKKAFDSIDREMLWKIFRHYDIPAKIVTMIQGLMAFRPRYCMKEGRLS